MKKPQSKFPISGKILPEQLKYHAVMVVIWSLTLFLDPSLTRAQPTDWQIWTDEQGRFSFSIPKAFGTPEPGTNHAFEDRVAAIRFSKFSSGMRAGKIVLGGEAVLTRGRVLVDIQAVGGLHDSITLEVFPETMRKAVLYNLPALKVSNFCAELAKEKHLDLNRPGFSSFSPQMKTAVEKMDRTRNIDPQVIRCDVSDDTITFHKEATYEAGAAKGRQHIYGAIRFLPAPFSSFQLVRAAIEPPSDETLKTITEVVHSIKITFPTGNR